MASELLKSAYEIARDARLVRNALVMQSLGLNLQQEEEEPQSKNKSASKTRPKQEATRASKRVRGLGPDGEKVEAEKKPIQETDDDFMSHRILRLKSLHEERQTGYSNPTATYEHTWMRVRTMSDKALMTRIKVIERAVGQHCLVKMHMFAEVLILAGKTDLAKEASEALDRLLLLTGGTPKLVLSKEQQELDLALMRSKEDF